MLALTNPIPTDFNVLRMDLNRLQLACAIPIVKGKILLGTHGRGDLYLTIAGPSPVIDTPPTIPPDLAQEPGFKSRVTTTHADGQVQHDYEVIAPNASPRHLEYIVQVARLACGIVS